MGSYLTLEADKLLMPDEDFHSEVSDELALLLKGLLKQKTGKNILVAGLGNQSVTPDSLGPRTVSNLCVSAEGLKAHSSRCYGPDGNGNCQDPVGHY